MTYTWSDPQQRVVKHGRGEKATYAEDRPTDRCPPETEPRPPTPGGLLGEGPAKMQDADRGSLSEEVVPTRTTGATRKRNSPETGCATLEGFLPTKHTHSSVS